MYGESTGYGAWALVWAPDGSALIFARVETQAWLDRHQKCAISIISYRRSVTSYRSEQLVKACKAVGNAILQGCACCNNAILQLLISLQSLPGWLWRHRPFQPTYVGF